MTAALLSGLALGGLVLLAGNDSGRRLQSLASGPALVPRPRRESRRRRREAVRVAAVEVPFALSLELRAGRSVDAALQAVADELASFGELSSRLRRAGAAAAAGGDMAGALAAGQRRPDDLAAALSVTAACCQACSTTGLPLSDLLEAAARAARARVALSGRAAAELAGARSTAVVLAGLPLVGLAMGQLLGARPLQVLLATPWGAACLALAGGLTGLGLLWSKAIHAGLRRTMP